MQSPIMRWQEVAGTLDIPKPSLYSDSQAQ